MVPDVAAVGQEYFSISLDQLKPDSVPGFDLYLRHAGGEPVLYRAANMPFTDEVRQRLLESGVHELFVPQGQAEQYRRYRREIGGEDESAAPGTGISPEEARLGDILADRSLPLDQRCDTLLGVSHSVVQAAFADLGSPGLPERVHRVAEETARFLLAEPEAYAALVGRLRIDYETCAHSMHTALYTTELVRSLGIGDPAEIAAIGRAALLHDVGKAEISPELLHKQGRLTDLEWAEVMSHTERGVTMLREAGWDDPVCAEVCMNHHERCDGSGYPHGLTLDQLSLAVRIVAITDTFDSLTSRRGSTPALSGFQALWKMKREMPGQFDPDLLDRFIQVMVEPAAH